MKTVRNLAFVSLLALSASAFGADKVCKLDIAGTDQMQYDKKELSVGADCTKVELTLKHTGKLPANVMGHNWVLSKTSDMMGVVNDGANVTPDHVKANDPRVIAHTKVVGGGQSDTVTFSTSALKKGESYTFFCTFPGHYVVMKGPFKVG